MNSTRDDNIANEYFLERIASGDQEAFQTLYLKYYNRLFRFAMMYLHSQELSEDVISDVFFNLWKNRSTLNDITYFDTYIFRCVRYGCGNVIKSGRYTHEQRELPEYAVYLSDDDAPSPLPDELLHYNDMVDALTQAVAQLPDRCRIIFKMAKEDKLSHKEISKILGLSVSTVEGQLAIAIRKIKVTLAPFLT